MSTTPNMNINTPTPGADEGTWGQELNEALETVDAHDHSPGKGTPVPVSGMIINAELDMHGHRTINQRQVQFKNLSSAEVGSSNAGSLQEINGNLYWINGSGFAVQLTDQASLAPVAVAPSYESGLIFPYAGASAPTGFLICDGSAVSRATYATLFGAINTTYGAGDGSTTFNLPNLAGRTPIGAGSYIDPVSGAVTRTLGQVIGAEKHVLTTTEMPSHSHGLSTDGAHTHNQAYSTDEGGFGDGRAVYNPNNGGRPAVNIADQNSGSHTHTVAPTGGGVSHNNMQPSLAINYIIKT